MSVLKRNIWCGSCTVCDPYGACFISIQSLANLRVFVLCLTMEAQDILADLFKMIFSIIK